MKSKDRVTVYSTQGMAEAAVVKSMLESYGVKCLLVSTASPSVHPYTVDGMGEVRIMVSPEDAETARELLSGTPESYPGENDPEDE